MAQQPPSSTSQPNSGAPAKAPRVNTRGTQARRPAPRTPVPFSAWPQWKKFTVTGLVATVIVSGTIWGATLKMRREAQAETLKAKEATTDEKIFFLERRREHLVKQKADIESKLSDLQKRMKARESGLTTR